MVYVESGGAVQLFRRNSSVWPFDSFQYSFAASYFILRLEFNNYYVKLDLQPSNA